MEYEIVTYMQVRIALPVVAPDDITAARVASNLIEDWRLNRMINFPLVNNIEAQVKETLEPFKKEINKVTKR